MTMGQKCLSEAKNKAEMVNSQTMSLGGNELGVWTVRKVNRSVKVSKVTVFSFGFGRLGSGRSSAAVHKTFTLWFEKCKKKNAQC